MNAREHLTNVERPTLAFRRLGSLVLLAHANVPPAPDDWQQYLDVLRPLLPDPALRALVLTDDIGPTAAQRESMNRALAQADVTIARTAVVSGGKLTRGIVTLLSWFNPGIRAFQPVQLDEALAYLEIEESRRGAVRADIADMRLTVAGLSPAARRAALSSEGLDPLITVTTPLAALRQQLEEQHGASQHGR